MELFFAVNSVSRLLIATVFLVNSVIYFHSSHGTKNCFRLSILFRTLIEFCSFLMFEMNYDYTSECYKFTIRTMRNLFKVPSAIIHGKFFFKSLSCYLSELQSFFLIFIKSIVFCNVFTSFISIVFHG